MSIMILELKLFCPQLFGHVFLEGFPTSKAFCDFLQEEMTKRKDHMRHKGQHQKVKPNLVAYFQVPIMGEVTELRQDGDIFKKGRVLYQALNDRLEGKPPKLSLHLHDTNYLPKR